VGGSVSQLEPAKAILDSRVKHKLRRSRTRQASNTQRVCQKSRLRSHASKSSRTSSLSRHTADEKVTRCNCGPGHMPGKGAPTCCRDHSSCRLSRHVTFKVCILSVRLTWKVQILDTSLQTCSLLVSANQHAHSAHQLPERLACAGEHVGTPDET
jgi:hypothetical protein